MKIGSSPDITDNIPAGFIPYVGAFWKADQTGERLIRMPRMSDGTIDSVWTAQVIEGRDWILLDTLMTTDPNVGWRTGANESAVENGNDFESNSARQLATPTASTFVSGMVRASTDPDFKPGNDQIYFRIGLKNKYIPTSTKPVRYGFVLLTYGNNRYRNRIWVRQGEGDDYLMRENDASTGDFVSATRPAAVLFSPYNLTTSGRINTPVSINGATGQPEPPAVFTEYPSQAGAIFQWANDTYKRYAYSPVGAGVVPWDMTPNATGFWTDVTYHLSTIYETCPAGYRRPADGVTDSPVGTTTLSPANMILSELRQSLLLNPVATDNAETTNTNSVYGYYADGFFDRRAIVTSDDNILNSAVSAGNNNIAYRGRLFYNPKPDSYASIFFPSAGYRLTNSPVGTLTYAGAVGYYWSSSSPNSIANGGGGKAISFNSTIVNFSSYDRPYGFSIRCVRTPNFLLVNPTALIFDWNATGTANQKTLTVTTNAPSWNVINVPSWLTVTPTSGSGTTFTVVPNSNNAGTTLRTATFTVTAGTAGPVTVTVSQYPNPGNVVDSPLPTVPAGFKIYVGAFWRADQTGERLIYIPRPASNSPIDGAWTATVYAGNDWITLDTQMTTDVNVGWRTDVPTPNESLTHSYENSVFDQLHPVLNGANTVSGTVSATTPYLYFRIGLKSQYTPTPAAPARYGVIVLTYNNNKSQRIWIRQGHDADYLFKSADPVGAGSAVASRTNACKQFAAYNLTADTYRMSVDIPGTSPAVNPGKFTLYPTQAGAMFQWISTSNPRFAWNPINPTTANMPGWVNGSFSGFWTAATAAIYETCPPGYHRPTDGPTDIATNTSTVADVNLSEMRNSLYLKIILSITADNANYNTYFGYYADGFFDRRKPQNAPGGTNLDGPGIASVVAIPTLNNNNVAFENVAYCGQLFFNPYSLASIFFPAPGQRMNGAGTLTDAGSCGFYWSSSSQNANTVYGMYIDAGIIHQQSKSPAAGYSIRCVKN